MEGAGGRGMRKFHCTPIFVLVDVHEIATSRQSIACRRPSMSVRLSADCIGADMLCTLPLKCYR